MRPRASIFAASSLRWQQMRYHLVWLLTGLGGGLALVVPAVLWIAPAPGPASRPPVSHASPTGPDGPRLVDGPRPALRAALGQTTIDPVHAEAARRLAAQMERARELVSAGDIARARSVLAETVRSGDGEALFLYAETFDPNQLAALGVRDVRAEPERARHLYSEALAKGIERARARLELLK